MKLKSPHSIDGDFTPETDYARALGGSTKRWSAMSAMAAILGTNPASAGAVRLANGDWIAVRNAANSADLNALSIDSSNNLNLGEGFKVDPVNGFLGVGVTPIANQPLTTFSPSTMNATWAHLFQNQDTTSVAAATSIALIEGAGKRVSLLWINAGNTGSLGANAWNSSLLGSTAILQAGGAGNQTTNGMAVRMLSANAPLEMWFNADNAKSSPKVKFYPHGEIYAGGPLVHMMTWEQVNNNSFGAGTGCDVATDGNVINGTGSALKLVHTVSSQALNIWGGPQVNLNPGNYVARYRVKYTNLQSGQAATPFITFAVQANKAGAWTGGWRGNTINYTSVGTFGTYNSVTASPNSFSGGSGAYSYFTVPFTVAEGDNGVQFAGAAWVTGVADLFMDCVEIFRDHPKDNGIDLTGVNGYVQAQTGIFKGSFGAALSTALEIQSTDGNGYSGGLKYSVTPSGGGGPYAAAFTRAENTNNGGASDGGQYKTYVAAQDGSHTLNIATIAHHDLSFEMLGLPKFSGTNSTGAGTPLFGSNSPATVLTAPYTWIKATAADGTAVYMPAWK